LKGGKNERGGSRKNSKTVRGTGKSSKIKKKRANVGDGHKKVSGKTGLGEP